MTEPAATVSTTITASAAKVWDALTDPDAIKQYFMGADVDTDWKVGSPITWSGKWKDQPFTDKGEILDVEAQRRLSYSHWSPLAKTEDSPENYHVVTVTLEPVDGGTQVELIQSNLIGGVTEADRRSREDYEKNWSMVLQGLKDTVES